MGLSEAKKEEGWQEIEYPGMGIKIHAKLNIEEDQLSEHVRINCARGLPQVWPHEVQDTVVGLVAGGPSLEDSVEEIRRLKKTGKIIALANTAQFLLDNDINPDAHVLLDGRPGGINFLTGFDCAYFVASQCDPKVFDALEGKNVRIWHAFNNPTNAVVKEHYEKWVPVEGGNTIALRALRLFQILGYYKFELFGMDSCNIDGKHHAYDQEAADGTETAKIALNGREFEVTATQIAQAMEFMKMVKIFGQHWELRSHGDGLISNMIKEGGKNGSDSMDIL